MPLVTIDGCDGVGKSSAIRQLKEKYPLLETFAFPTPAIRKKVEGRPKPDPRDLGALLRYHYQFMEDFVNHQEYIHNILEEGKILILDRYIYSNYVYLMLDVIIHATVNDYKPEFVFKMNKVLRDICQSLYEQLVKPDTAIYIHGITSDCKDFCSLHDTVFESSVDDKGDVVLIRGLRPDTFSKLESELKKRGYLL
jgi:thymidylate kinase